MFFLKPRKKKKKKKKKREKKIIFKGNLRWVNDAIERKKGNVLPNYRIFFYLSFSRKWKRTIELTPISNFSFLSSLSDQGRESVNLIFSKKEEKLNR